jgi:ABC-type multidrug transport system ATPase subunit
LPTKSSSSRTSCPTSSCYLVEHGELVTLIGANGAGKTTTMKASSSEIRRNKAAIQGGEQAEWPRLVRASATR